MFTINEYSEELQDESQIQTDTKHTSFKCSNCGHVTSGEPAIASIEYDQPRRLLIESNCIPDDSEAALIHESILAAEKEIGLLDDEISRLQSMLNQVKVRRTKVMGYTHQQRQVLSPLRRLPNEVLSEIFLSYMDGRKIEIYNLQTRNPWHLGQVCSRWRAVVLSTPTLWSKFVLNGDGSSSFDSDDSDDSECGYLRLVSCLSRSGSSPLSFTIKRLIETVPFWNAVAFQSHRWEKVALFRVSLTLQQLYQLKGKLDSLISLDFDGCDLILPEEVYETVDIFAIAPRLSSLSLSYLPSDSITKWHFPWHQISQLALLLSGVDAENITIFLSGLLNVQEITWNDERSAYPVLTNPVRLPHLRILGCGAHSKKESTILNTFTAPQLTALRLFLTHFADSDSMSAIIRFLERSQCTLTELSIRSSFHLPIVELATRGFLSRVSVLELQSIKSSSTVYDEIVSGTEYGLSLFPSLKELRVIEDDAPSQADLERYIASLEARVLQRRQTDVEQIDHLCSVYVGKRSSLFDYRQVYYSGGNEIRLFYQLSSNSL